MRMVRARVKSYRVLGDVEVDFDAARTVIGGPNESGKSTFMEAVQRCLFLRAKASGAVREGMVSRIHGGHPTVEVAFEVGGVEYAVSKEFRGASGLVRLAQGGGGTLTGDAAEERLAALLGVEVAEGGKRGVNQSMGQWAHLFVWQGEGWDDPTERATEQRDALVARLEAGGGVAAMVSARDSAVAERFAGLERQWFKGRGEARAGTELELAERGVERARQRVGRAREAWERLGQAAERLARAQEVLVRRQDEIRGHEAEAERVRLELGRVGELRGREREEAGEASRLEREESKLRVLDGQIARLRRQREGLDERLGELREAVLRGEGELAAAAAATEVRRAELIAAEARLAGSRRRHERVRALAERDEVVQAAERLRSRVASAARLRAEAAVVRAEQAGLAAVGEPELGELRRASAELAAAGAALGAMVARVELVAGGGQEVRVGGAALGEGEGVNIDEVVEVEVGAVRLLVRPGGGQGLAGARERERRARLGLGEKLAALGLGGLEEAERVLERRARLGGQLGKIEGELAGLGGDELERELERVEGRLAVLEGVLGRGGGDEDGDCGAGGWRAREVELEGALGEVEAELRRLEGERAAAEAAEVKVREGLAGRGRELAELEREAHGLRVQIETLEGEAGDGDLRLARLGELAAERTAAASRLEGTRRELAALDPEGLEADRARLGRALAEAREGRERAGREAAAERAVLVWDGAVDPAAELEAAQAELDAAELVWGRVERRGAAVRLLARLFGEEQARLAERFTRPLAERAAVYLGRVLGGEVGVTVKLEEGSFGGLGLVRGGEAYGFGELSGGAREQVAAAFRLAMAEVLAEEHGGCLPVVFDDAFVNADPERVRGLLRMLDLAACRGLQVVVLSCDPGRYGGLGGRVIEMLKC